MSQTAWAKTQKSQKWIEDKLDSVYRYTYIKKSRWQYCELTQQTIFNLYYGLYKKDERLLKAHQKALSDTLRFNHQAKHPQIFGQLGEIATFEIWAQEGFPIKNYVLFKDEFSDLLTKSGKKLLKKNHRYEFAISIGNLSVLQENDTLLELVLKYLEDQLEKTPWGLGWFEYPTQYSKIIEPQFKKRRLNLGIAHGLPGILAFALICLKRNKFKRRSRKIALVALDLLVKISSEKASPFFPVHISENDHVDSALPIINKGWCYGDTGVGYILSWAARILEKPELSPLADKVFFSGMNPQLTPPSLVDGHFCHGYSGLLQLANRHYNLTGSKRSMELSHHWTEQLSGDFKKTFFTRPEAGHNTNCLLYNPCGPGLALLAAVSKIEPRWDQLFLLS